MCPHGLNDLNLFLETWFPLRMETTNINTLHTISRFQELDFGICPQLQIWNPSIPKVNTSPQIHTFNYPPVICRSWLKSAGISSKSWEETRAKKSEAKLDWGWHSSYQMLERGKQRCSNLQTPSSLKMLIAIKKLTTPSLLKVPVVQLGPFVSVSWYPLCTGMCSPHYNSHFMCSYRTLEMLLRNSIFYWSVYYINFFFCRFYEV